MPTQIDVPRIVFEYYKCQNKAARHKCHFQTFTPRASAPSQASAAIRNRVAFRIIT